MTKININFPNKPHENGAKSKKTANKNNITPENDKAISKTKYTIETNKQTKKSDIHKTNNTEIKLSDRQINIYNFIVEYIKNNNYSPSIREISKAIGLSSTSSAKYQIDKLIKLGYLLQKNNKSRTLIPIDKHTITASEPHSTTEIKEEYNTTYKHNQNTVPKKITENSIENFHEIIPIPIASENNDELINIPLLGQIAAGSPILADDTVEDIYPLPRQLTGFGEFFMLTVKGESMLDAAIRPGDKIVVRKQNTANDGEIIAALIGDEATVKVLSHKQGHRWLLPKNENYKPILGDEAIILGKVVTVLRTL